MRRVIENGERESIGDIRGHVLKEVGGTKSGCGNWKLNRFSMVKQFRVILFGGDVFDGEENCFKLNDILQ